MSRTVARRIFVVGCSRSGTTLLQGILANHSRVHTFPETGAFLKAFGMRARLLPWAALGLTLGKERKALARLLSSRDGSAHGGPVLPPRRVLLSRSISDIVGVLDALAAAHEKDVWVEKTPRHVLHARRIQRAVPDSLCLHLVRRGEDVVASIVDRARRYPDRFPRQSHPAYGVRQWNRSLQASALAIREPGHVVLFYETLVAELGPVLQSLCRILGLEFEEGMLAPAHPSSFTDPSEAWKSSVNRPVAPSRSKFPELFDEPTRAWISRELDSGTYRDLQARAAESPGGVFFSG